MKLRQEDVFKTIDESIDELKKELIEKFPELIDKGSGLLNKFSEMAKLKVKNKLTAAALDITKIRSYLRDEVFGTHEERRK